MDARAGHLADRAQVAEGRAPVAVDRHTAARVVGRGDDGNGPGREVEAILEAALDELGKPASDPLRRFVRDVEKDIRLVLLEHALVDGARDDVAGRELPVGVDLLEERLSRDVRDAGALAAQRLGQKQASFRMHERGRVELDVLEVQEPCAGAPRHREAVSAGSGRVGRVQIDLAEAARGEDRLAREVRRDAVAVAREQVRADDGRRVVPVGGIGRVVREREQIHRRRLEQPADVLLLAARLEQRALDGSARRVLDMQDPGHRVRPLERPVEACPVAVEGHGKLLDEQRLDEVRALAGNERDRFGRAEPVARARDVGGELLGRVARRPADDAALGVVGVRLARLVGPRHERDRRAVSRGRERRRAAGHSRAENEDVGGLRAHTRKSSSETSAAATECVSAPTETASAPASA